MRSSMLVQNALALTTSSSRVVHLKSVRYSQCPNFTTFPLNTRSLPCTPHLTSSITLPSNQWQVRILESSSLMGTNSYCGLFFSCHFSTVFFPLRVLITPQIMYQWSTIWSNGKVNLLHVAMVRGICYSHVQWWGEFVTCTMVRWICYSLVQWWDEFLTFAPISTSWFVNVFE